MKGMKLAVMGRRIVEFSGRVHSAITNSRIARAERLEIEPLFARRRVNLRTCVMRVEQAGGWKS
jgi:hypothetical protein